MNKKYVKQNNDNKMDRNNYCIVKIGISFEKEVLTYTSLCDKPVTCDWEACGPEHCKLMRIAKAHSIGRMVTEPPWDCSVHSDSDSDSDGDSEDYNLQEVKDKYLRMKMIKRHQDGN
jgi:hypothetical protein